MTENQFEDAEAYSFNYNKDQLSFKQIVLTHLQKISGFASVEWCGGYWLKRVKNNLTEEIYIPDSREVYCNAVDYLADILYPHFDNEIKNSEEDINKKIEQAEKKFFEQNKDKDLNWKKQNFRLEKVGFKRKLFRELCSFLYRRKYLEIGMISDE